MFQVSCRQHQQQTSKKYKFYCLRVTTMENISAYNTVSTGNLNNAVCGPVSNIVQISVVDTGCRGARLEVSIRNTSIGCPFLYLFRTNSAGIRVFKTQPLSLDQCCFENFACSALDKQYSNNSTNIVYIFMYTNSRALKLSSWKGVLRLLVRFVWMIRINKLNILCQLTNVTGFSGYFPVTESN